MIEDGPVYDHLCKSYAQRRVALIGGGGQVGSFLAPLLDDAGAEIAIFDQRPSFTEDRPYDIVDRPDQLRGFLRWWKPAYVFNLAAKVSGVTYNERAHFDMSLTNGLLQALPLWACQDISTRFVQFSTVCTLPHDAPVPAPEIPVEELGLPEPTNLGYGLAKQWGEWLCKFAAAEAPQLRPLVIRPSNLYGRERPDDPHGHVIPRLTWRLLNREDPMAIRGLPTTRRGFLHAQDCAEAAALLASSDYVGTVNVGPVEDVSISTLLAMLSHCTGHHPAEVTWGCRSEQGYAARLSSLRRFDSVIAGMGLPRWRPRIELMGGLKEYVEWAKGAVVQEATGAAV